MGGVGAGAEAGGEWGAGTFELWAPQQGSPSAEDADFCEELGSRAGGSRPGSRAEQLGAEEPLAGLEEALAGEEEPAGPASRVDLSPEWRELKREAKAVAEKEPLLSSFMHASVISHYSFERALASILANRLSDATLLPTHLFRNFREVLLNQPHVLQAAREDLTATVRRDPACASRLEALLYYKGYHAVQAYRLSHEFWRQGKKLYATALQSRCSEVLGVDIHPAARLGRGLLLDHGQGVVIGATAVVGNQCSILHGVTLGGTGKEEGDRHPKLGSGVLVAAHATLLGSIRVGDGAIVQAGSLVLKDVEAHTRWAGIPAKQVGVVSGKPAQEMTQLNVKEETTFCDTWGEAVRQAVLAEEEGLAGAPAALGSGDVGGDHTGVTVSLSDGEVTYSFGGELGGRGGEGGEGGPGSGPGNSPEPDSEPPPTGEGREPHLDENLDFGCGI